MSDNISNFDFEEANKYLEIISSQKTFIKPNILYTLKDIEQIGVLRSKFKKQDFEQIILFSSKEIKNQSKDFFLVEIQCPKCFSIRKEKLPKTKFIDYINIESKIYINPSWQSSLSFYYKDKYCKICKNILDEISLKQRKQKEENEEKQKINDINRKKEELFNYLNPNFKWDKNIKLTEKIKILRTFNFTEDIIQYIKKIPYKDFLQTPYWKTISDYKKYKQDYTCELCGTKKFKNKLNTHHPTYDIRGEELFYLDKLKVLCNICHEKFHNIVKD